MSEQFHIKSGERGLVRLFAIDVPEAEIPGFSHPDHAQTTEPSPWAFQQALGAEFLDPAHVDIFPVSNLTGLGLSGYLVEGLGIAEADIHLEKARLDALQGHVAVVRSKAFGGHAQTLKLSAALRWIGTYTEEATPVQFEPLPDAGAQGEITPASTPKPSDAAMSGRIAMVVLMLLALFVTLLIWIAA